MALRDKERASKSLLPPLSTVLPPISVVLLLGGKEEEIERRKILILREPLFLFFIYSRLSIKKRRIFKR